MQHDVDVRDASFIAKAPGFVDEVRGAAERASRAGALAVAVNRLNPATGSPAVIHCEDGPAAGEGHLVAAAHALLLELREVLGFTPGDVAEFAADSGVQATTSGARVVHLQQQFHGIPVFQMRRSVTFDQRGRATRIKGDNVAIASDLALLPDIDAATAVKHAGEHVAERGRRDTERPMPVDLPQDWMPTITAALVLPARPTVVDASPFGTPTTAHLVVFHARPQARLAWNVELLAPDGEAHFTVVVDARTGDILLQQQRTHRAVSGNVYTRDPDSTPRATITWPRGGGEYLIPVPAGRAFPRDWCADEWTDGNNVRAMFDGDQLRLVRGDRTATGDLLFEPGEDLGDDQLVVNAFYYCNLLHDFYELLGFDDSHGNFERGSRSATGQLGKPMDVVVKPDFTTGIASMSTHVEPPTMKLGPYGDKCNHTALDFTLVTHEYTHGVANRLVGGAGDGSALSEPQSNGISEGLADFFAVSLANQQRPDGAAEVKGVGCWLKGNDVGLRRWPYVAGYNGTFAELGTDKYLEPHDVGELCCATLLDILRAMPPTFDQERSYRVLWLLVLNALKLVESNPSFLDLRDGLLEALDDVHADDHPENHDHLTTDEHDTLVQLMWTVFAARGMGHGATCNRAALDNPTIVPSYELPPA